MRESNTLRLSAKNSLRMNQITQKEEKNMLNTFKAGSDLRGQLNKAKVVEKTNKLDTHKATIKQSAKMQQQLNAQQVASLDHFKVPVSSDKTKNIIENIKLRRRQKHIDALNRFKQDVNQYKQNLLNAYQSLINDTDQVMAIKMSNILQFLNSINNKQYLLSRQKQLLSQINQTVTNYQSQCDGKLNFAKQQLSRIQSDRSQMAGDICSNLRMAVIEIAFILQPEALAIQKTQRNDIQKMQQSKFQQYKQKLDKIISQQQSRNQKVKTLSKQIEGSWKRQKQQYQIQNYIEQAKSPSYKRPNHLRLIFDRLMKSQMDNSLRKLKIITQLTSQEPDSLTKINIDKVNEGVKKISQNFDHVLDQLLAQFKQANIQNKKSNQLRLQQCKARLIYIQNHNDQQVKKIIQQKCAPLCNKNIQQQQMLIKSATNSAENQQAKQNKIIQGVIKFMSKIGEQNDGFNKQFSNLNQKYEIEKAKILDDDQELVDKLNQELNALKVQLRDSLHHIKLDQIQKKCFQKVDQIQKAYRLCHQRNKSLKETRTPSLELFMKKYQSKLAQIFQLFDVTRRNELQQKNKKQREDQAQRRLQLEQNKKAEQELKLAEQAKLKGGKAPPPAKPKDPKKALAQQQQKKKAILAQMGIKKIEQIKTQAGSIWLVYKSILQICQGFYKDALKQFNQKKQGKQQVKLQNLTPKNIDASQQEIKDSLGAPVINTNAFIRIANLVPLFQNLRIKIFKGSSDKKIRVIDQSQKIDEEMLQQSLINLDNRLKAHYSLKGTIENQIFVKRFGQITNHKKKYQKYAKNVKQKIDLQTQKFNFLLQKGLQSLKNHMAQQKTMKESIIKCKNLSQLQGMYSRTKQNYNTFGLNIKQIYNQLDRLSSNQIQVIFKKNQQFIKEFKLIKDGGEYSAQEIQWYQQMMSEITKQINEQQLKRKQKLAELKQHSEKKKQQLMENFEKQYNNTTQQLSARDGTGKKYGKPKRIALQKIRLQMNKCEQSQININDMIASLTKQYEKNSKNQFQFEKQPDFLTWRKKLMTVYFCILKYSKHIEALKPDLKINQMIRVNYNLKSPDPKLPPQQEQEDKKRKQQQLKSLGKLSQQKDEKCFLKYIQDIEKLISEQSRTIYTGEKAKFLTGNDKIPDFLRVYIANMKKGAEVFRVSSSRQLRQSCQRLSSLSANLSELFFKSILSFYLKTQKQKSLLSKKKIVQISQRHKNLRSQHMRKLRPNLSNPTCQQQLKQLDNKESQRNSQYKKQINQTQTQFKDNMFLNGESFLNCLLNNYQFLLLLTDSFYLNEDFIKLPGDQIEEKTHLNIQKLLVMKQKGIKIDPNSQRNLKKKWDGLNFSVYNIQNRKYEYKKTQQVPKDKDKKSSKKDTKDAKKPQQNINESDPDKTKAIQTYKTWRQKSVFEARQQVNNKFKIQFDKTLKELSQKIQIDKRQNNVHEKKWRQIADSLYIK